MNYKKMTKAELIKTITSLQTSGEAAQRADAWQRRARKLQARQQAKEALRAREERFRAIYEFSPIGIVNIDGRGKFIRANSAYQKIFGYSEEELRTLSFADITYPDDIEASSQTFKEMIEGRRDVDRLEKRCIRKDGQIVWIRLTRYPIRDVDGNFLHTVSMVEDISERKQAEEERRQLEAQMQHAQKLESLGILAGGIAHDFNNLLVGILGNASFALTELPPGSPARQSIGEVEVAARRAAELTNQMLAYSGKGKFVVERVNLSTLVEEIAHLLHSVISKKAVLKFEFQDDLPAVEGDPTQLRQVVMNLITNAAEAIGNHEGLVAVRTATMQVDRELLSEFYHGDGSAAESYAGLEVSDNGCGMDAETKSRIFDPFFTTKFTGRGLGLAAVLGIVRGHHGAIKVDSEPGRGTTFRVLFPAAQWSAQSIEHPINEPLASSDWRGRGGILVVDDEKAVQNVTKKILEHFGFTVLTADDGRHGLEIFRKHVGEIKVVLLDLTMPHMDGEEAFREMRRLHADVRVILSSGYTEQDAIDHFKGMGLAGFIQKPYSPETLIGKFRQILESSM